MRKEYQAFNVATRDGRVLSGLIVDQTPEAITLRDAKGERTRVARSEIEDLKEMENSLMPDSLYKELSPEQLRGSVLLSAARAGRRSKGTTMTGHLGRFLTLVMLTRLCFAAGRHVASRRRFVDARL